MNGRMILHHHHNQNKNKKKKTKQSTTKTQNNMNGFFDKGDLKVQNIRILDEKPSSSSSLIGKHIVLGTSFVLPSSPQSTLPSSFQISLLVLSVLL